MGRKRRGRGWAEREEGGGREDREEGEGGQKEKREGVGRKRRGRGWAERASLKREGVGKEEKREGVGKEEKTEGVGRKRRGRGLGRSKIRAELGVSWLLVFNAQCGVRGREGLGHSRDKGEGGSCGLGWVVRGRGDTVEVGGERAQREKTGEGFGY